MDLKKNYYEILKVSPLASQEAIKKSYRKLARRHHPDKQKGSPLAEETFKNINTAYEILSDTFKRREFDRKLKKQKEEEDKKNRPGFKPMYDSFYAHPEKDLAQKDSFQPSEKESQKFCGNLSITLEEGLLGCIKKIIPPGQKSPLTFTIPAGAKDRQKIFVKKNKQNFYAVILFKDHLLFKKENNDLVLELPIPLSLAVLGGEASVPTLTGLVSFPISKGLQSGQKIRLAGKGFPLEPGAKKHGDILIKILISTPTDLLEKELLWIKALSKKKYPPVIKFQTKVKEFLKKESLQNENSYYSFLFIFYSLHRFKKAG